MFLSNFKGDEYNVEKTRGGDDAYTRDGFVNHRESSVYADNSSQRGLFLCPKSCKQNQIKIFERYDD